MTGRSPDGSGSRASHGAANASSPKASIPNAYGEPVSTVAELDALDPDEIVEGYFDGRNNEPEPSGNRSKAYWHGWRNGMADAGHRKIDAAQRQLAHEVVKQSRAKSERTGA